MKSKKKIHSYFHTLRNEYFVQIGWYKKSEEIGNGVISCFNVSIS